MQWDMASRVYNANRYHWVADKVIGTPFVLNTIDVIAKVDIRLATPRIGCSPCSPEGGDMQLF